MDLRNSNGIELRNFYFTTYRRSFFCKFLSESVKLNASYGTQLRYFQIKSVKNPSIRLKILTYEISIQSYIKTE